LIIPTRDDKDGSEARDLRHSGKWQVDPDEVPGSHPATSDTGKPAKPAGAPKDPSTHTVGPGQRLGSIAKRYHVSVEAICYANDIKQNAAIRPGQKLLIPDKSDKDGERARQFRLEQAGPQSGGSGSWTRYRRTPKRRGYATLITYNTKWSGRIVGKDDLPLPEAVRVISGVLTTPDSDMTINARLIRLLATVSDTFGGSPLRVVSGYRTTSFVSDSRHKSGHAVDFSIPGVPNEALRDFLRTFTNVGVGYYPNSTFVHFDVREEPAYWVDYAGPGEAPVMKPPPLARQ
jgi:LysM repeat protein